MITDNSIEEVLKNVPDPQKIIGENPVIRRGLCIQDIQFWLYSIDLALIPFAFKVINQHNYELSQDWNPDWVEEIITTGIFSGIHAPTGIKHAVAIHENMIHDPMRREPLSVQEYSEQKVFRFEEFYKLVRIKSK